MSLKDGPSDLELMQRISSKDLSALELLYARYSPIIYTLVKKIITDRTTADEVLIEVFEIMWTKINFFDFQTSNVYTWIITLARNKAIDSIRRSRNAEMKSYDLEYEREFIIPKLSRLIDPLDLATSDKISPTLSKAMNNLTEAQKFVISLSYYEGLTEQEIASRLNIPLQTVKHKIKVALNNLKENLLKDNSYE